MRKRALTVLLALSMAITTAVPAMADENTSVVSESVDTGTEESSAETADTEITENKEQETAVQEEETAVQEETQETADTDESGNASEEVSGENVQENQAEEEDAAETEAADIEEAEDSAEVNTADLAQVTYELVTESGKMYLKGSDGTYYYGLYEFPDTEKIMYFDEEQDGAATVSKVVLVEDAETGEKVARLFDENGYMVTGKQIATVNGKKYCLIDSVVQKGWTTYENHRLYLNPSTYEVTTGIVKVEGSMRLFDNNGYCKFGTRIVILNGKKYYIKDNILQSGWVTVNNLKMYYNPKTYEVTTGVAKIGGILRLFTKYGYLVTGKKIATVNGKKYCLINSVVQKGWTTYQNHRMYLNPKTYEVTTGIVKIGTSMRLFDNNGYCIMGSKVVTLNGKKYYVKNSILQSGWVTVGNNRRYCNPKTYVMTIGIAKIENVMRLFDNNGYCVMGTKVYTLNGKIYYIKKSVLQSGWVTTSAGKMYLSTKTYAAFKGVHTISGKPYLFTAKGILVTGTKTIVVSGKRYYVKNGILQKGWATVNGMKMYLDNTTYAAYTGTHTINGKTYVFNENGFIGTGAVFMNNRTYYYKSDGTLYKNTWIIYNGEKIYINGNGIGLTDRSSLYSGAYTIKVDKANCVVTVYKGGVPVRAMQCSVGLSSTPTYDGVYSVGTKYRIKELMGPSWGQYATAVAGQSGVYFHSVATTDASDVVHSVPVAEYNKLGSPASHGCIRLTVRDAKWIYDNIPAGTPIYIGYYNNPLGKPYEPPISYSVDPTDPATY